jgi:hypothetical protein
LSGRAKLFLGPIRIGIIRPGNRPRLRPQPLEEPRRGARSWSGSATAGDERLAICGSERNYIGYCNAQLEEQFVAQSEIGNRDKRRLRRMIDPTASRSRRMS